MCGDFKGDRKTLFGWLFLRQHYLQVTQADQATEEPDESEEAEPEQEDEYYEDENYGDDDGDDYE